MLLTVFWWLREVCGGRGRHRGAAPLVSEEILSAMFNVKCTRYSSVVGEFRHVIVLVYPESVFGMSIRNCFQCRHANTLLNCL
jgi:hypothetical protein